MLNKGYDPDTLRAMSLAAGQGRETARTFSVDGVCWLVDYWLRGSPSEGFSPRLSDVWINGQWVDADEVLSRPLIEVLTEQIGEVSNAQA